MITCVGWGTHEITATSPVKCRPKSVFRVNNNFRRFPQLFIFSMSSSSFLDSIVHCLLYYIREGIVLLGSTTLSDLTNVIEESL